MQDVPKDSGDAPRGDVAVADNRDDAGPGGESSRGREGPVETDLDLTVVLPCLNEAETVEICVERALESMADHDIDGEVIVADNGSTDGSQELAREAGARVVDVPRRGYGAAIQGGIEAARGKYVVQADADDSYALEDVHKFYAKLSEGYDLVMGNRFEGGIQEGAMPFLHKYLGNPVLSWIGRLFFSSDIGDFHCGLRGFDRDKILELDVKTTGMEFASELVVKAELHELRIAEIPTILRPDGRSGDPHLNTWQDGWRHLRFLLLYSPKWLFLLPGLLLMVGGGGLLSWLYYGHLTVGSVTFSGVHSMMYASLAVLIGFQCLWFGIFTKNFAVSEGLLPSDPSVETFRRLFSLEGGITLGVLLVLAGIGGAVYAFYVWKGQAFGALEPARTLEVVIPSFLSIALGVQMVFSSFFVSVLNLKHR